MSYRSRSIRRPHSDRSVRKDSVRAVVLAAMALCILGAASPAWSQYPDLVASVSSLTITEGSSKSYTIKLASRPTATATVYVTGTHDTDLSVEGSPLEFTTDTWNSPQTVTVSAGEDSDDANDSGTLKHVAFGICCCGTLSGTLPVTVVDNERFNLVLSPASLTVGEGSSATYTVKLVLQPTGNVTVSIGGTSGTDLSLNRSALTFSTGNWNSPQSVRVTARQDDDRGHDSETITHTASGGGYGSASANLPVTVTDDDVADLVLSPTSLTIEEGRSGAYTVRLAARPDGDVSLTLDAFSGDNLTLDKYGLTFNTNNWNNPQTVRVTAGQDPDGANENEGVWHAGSGGGYGSVFKSIFVDVTDDDTPDLVLSERSLTINEGGNTTYTVKLAIAPTEDVTVTIGGWSGTDLSLNNSTLTFDTNTWNSPQTVRVTAGTDMDGINDSETLTHTASGGGYGSVSKNLPVTVTDKDAPNLLLSDGSLTIDEGDNRTYTVRLATLPTGNVTVTIDGTSGTDLDLDKTTLTFTTNTWNSPQTVRVTAGQDDDGAEDTATLTHRASSGGYAGVSKGLLVTVTDNDTPDLVLSTNTLGINESESETYTVKLATQPTGNVTVTIGGFSGTDLSLNTSRLSFNTNTWNSPRTVRVTARTDMDNVNDSETLTHTASGADYGAVSKNLPVTVTDDDVPNLLLSPGSLTIDEGLNRTYTVKLATQPTGTVTVTVGGWSGTDLSLDKDELTFGTDTWNSAQTVRVTANTDDDGAVDSETLTHTASGGGYGAISKDLPVTVTDNDTPDLLLSERSLTINEGENATYTVALATQPTATVTVTISGWSGTDLSLNNSTLTFNRNTWNSPQTVRVTAGTDSDGTNDSETLTHTASGSDYGSIGKTLPVTVTDKDAPNLLLTPTSLPVDEGEDETYTVELTTLPSADVTVSIRIGTGADLSLDKNSLTFLTTTWNSPQTVRVTARQDPDAANNSATLTHTASGGDYGSVKGELTVNVTDDDTPDLLLVPVSLGVNESESANYTVELATQPTATVTVTISGWSGTDLSLNRPTLTFSRTTWNAPQTVRVTARADMDMDNDNETLTHTASGGDYGSVGKALPVTVTDDDVPNLLLSPGSLTLNEGDDKTYTVKLATQPSGTVTVSVGGWTGTDLTLDKDELTYNTTTWNRAQTVRVTANDDTDKIDDSETLTHTASGGGYGGVSKDLPVTVTDNDKPRLILSRNSLTIDEGGRVAYTVKLATQPTGDVTVSISGTSGTDLSLNNSSLAFDTNTWNSPQTVSVTAGQDGDASNDSATLRHMASGGDYGGVSKYLSVTVRDDDVGRTRTSVAVQVSFAQATYTATEGGGATTVSLYLNQNPRRKVVVPLTVTMNGGATQDDYTGVPEGITFYSDQLKQSFDVTAVDDDVYDGGESLTFGFGRLPSGVSTGKHATSLIILQDNDGGFRVSFDQPTYAAEEGGADAVVRVRLSKDATREVSIPLTATYVGGATEEDFRDVPEQVTFGRGESEKTIRVAAVDDDMDDDGESLTLGFEMLPDGFREGENAVTSVNIRDNDDPVVIVSFGRPAYESREGGPAAVVRVQLSADPERRVSIPLTATPGNGATTGDYSGVPDSTVFLSGQTTTDIVVTAIDDNLNDNDETLTLTIGTPPERVNVGSPATTVVRLADNDDPPVTISIGAAEYTAEEGGQVASISLRLSADPERQVIIPLDVTPGNGATQADYRVPSMVTFSSGDTIRTVELHAVDDDVDDDGETVALGFGTLPAMVNAGDLTTATVTLTDNDERGVNVSPTSLSIAEEDTGRYTVTIGSAPTAAVTIVVTGMENTDVSVDRTRLTFTARNWEVPQEVEVRSRDDADAIADQVTLRHTISGGDYTALEAPSVVITVLEDELPAITVADQKAPEGALAIVFAVVMDMPSSEEVTVKYATSNGTAVAGADYTTTQGTLRFTALQTRQTIRVPIIDDDVDEDAETFTLTLTEPVNAVLAGGTAIATGTIDDNDAASEALEVLLSSVGRMVATDVINVVSGRFDQPMGIEPSLTLGGLPVGSYGAGRGDRSRYAAGSRLSRPSTPGDEPWIPLETQISHPHGLNAPASFESRSSASGLLYGSDFEMPLTRTDRVGAWVLWGQITLTGFSSLPNAIRRMDADGFTGYLGIEYQMRRNLLVGLALTHSRGDLDYNHVKTRNTLVPSDYGITSLMPYVHLQVRPGLGIWGMAGYGRGSSDMQDLLGFHDADLRLMMGATGARQELSSWHGIGFAVKGDAFYVRTKSDGTVRLPDVRVEAKRVRLMIESRRTLAFDPVLRFTPSVEIGARWDRGHVEKGAGIDVGGGFQLAHADRGVSLSTHVRYLLIHQQDAREEWGLSLIMRIDPGLVREGIVMDISPVWGAPGGGPEGLWRSNSGLGFGSPRGAERAANVRPDRMQFNLGYQLLTHKNDALVTPYVGWTTGVHGFQRYRIGSRLFAGTAVDMNLEGMRQLSAHRSSAYGLMLRGRMRW